MAHLSLTTVSGNSVIRHFPFQGYLGLTPVHIEGIVQIRLEAKQKRIPAKLLTVSVRAYESRRTGTSQTRVLVDYSQTLWSKPSDQPYAELGDFQSPFKITLPKGVAGFSTVNYQDYRTYWRVEATLEHAVASKSDTVLSKHLDLLLTRHDISHPLSSPPLPYGPNIDPALPLRTDKLRAPVLHYNISTPTHAVGPSDLLFTSVFIRPVDRSVKLRSVSLLVERSLVLYDLNRPKSPLPANPFHAHVPSGPSSPERGSADNVFAFGIVRSPSSSPVIIPQSVPYPSPPTSREGTGRQKIVTSTVAVAQAAAFSFDRETGVWTKTVSLQWPASKGQSRWPVGETVRGALGSVSFWVKAKVIVTSPSGTESIDLQPREILVVLTSDAERRCALEASGSAGDFMAEYTPPPYTAPAPYQPVSDMPDWGGMGTHLPMSVTPNGTPRTAGSMTSSSHIRTTTPSRKGLKAALARLLGRANRSNGRP